MKICFPKKLLPLQVLGRARLQSGRQVHGKCERLAACAWASRALCWPCPATSPRWKRGKTDSWRL